MCSRPRRGQEHQGKLCTQEHKLELGKKYDNLSPIIADKLSHFKGCL